MSDMVIKGTGPNQSVSLSGRSDDPLYTRIDVSQLPKLQLEAETGVKLAGTAGLKGDIRAEAKADVQIGGNLGIKLALPALKLLPDLRIRFRLLGFTVGEIEISGSARLES